jgi:hypothetical protein
MWAGHYAVQLSVSRLHGIGDRIINKLATETEILGEHMSHCHFVHHKSHTTGLGHVQFYMYLLPTLTYYIYN